MIVAVVWHWWIGLVLAIGSIGLVAQLVIGYITKVSRPRYPRDKK